MRLIDGDELKIRMLDYYAYSWQICEEIGDFFENTPTIEPERKGKWILRNADNGYHTDCICSECKTKYAIGWNYCPNCGSYNGGEQNENR